MWILLCMCVNVMQLQHHLWKRLPLLHCIFFAPFSKISSVHFSRSVVSDSAIPWTAACLLIGGMFPSCSFLVGEQKKKCCQVSFSENPEADRETNVVTIWGRRLSRISGDLGHTSFPSSRRSGA